MMGEARDLSLEMTKEDARRLLRERRDGLAQNEIRRLSREACGHLRELSWYREAGSVFFYHPLGSEMDLLPLAREALAAGKCVAFPRVDGMDMEFYRVRGLGEFKEGRFHVMEPTGNEAVPAENAIVLVPGIGFDESGGRIGYGKGYYDRYLAKYPKCCKIGATYRSQVECRLPRDAHDVVMDALLTEDGILAAKA